MRENPLKTWTAKLCCLAPFLFVLALPASAQVQYCIGGGITCQYLRDQAFSNGPVSNPTLGWLYGSASWWTTVTDPCALNATSLVAKLPAGGGVRQEFNATGTFAYWSVSLDVYFGDAGGTSNDRINVYVENLDTNVSEIFSLDATQYGLCAGQVTFNLSNDYSDADVAVTLRRATKSKMNQISVDNASFWGSLYP